MKLTMLGTGNALVTECYNTCFVLDDSGQRLMVDGGGGSGILAQLKHVGYDWMDMRHIFVTHKHMDHLLGIVWMVRTICQFMEHGKYEGEAWIYSHTEVLEILRDHGWNGYLLSEYEGADKYDQGYEVGQTLRRHHIMMKNILGY